MLGSYRMTSRVASKLATSPTNVIKLGATHNGSHVTNHLQYTYMSREIARDEHTNCGGHLETRF